MKTHQYLRAEELAQRVPWLRSLSHRKLHRFMRRRLRAFRLAQNSALVVPASRVQQLKGKVTA